MKEIKINGFIIEEIHGNRKIEDVFREVYELYFGVKVKVRRKTPEELEAYKQAN
ncbi:hypothetical protein PVK73_19780 [Bacillus thuringiensis]